MKAKKINAHATAMTIICHNSNSKPTEPSGSVKGGAEVELNVVV